MSERLGAFRSVLVTGNAALEAVVRPWAERRFARSLLVLGDWTDPLRTHARHFAMYDTATTRVGGLAVRFHGFGRPVASLVADDATSATRLVDGLREEGAFLLAVADSQVLPHPIMRAAVGVDPWLVGPCDARQEDPEVIPLDNSSEVAEYFRRLDMQFFCPDMLKFGHAYGIRGCDRSLVCVGLLNFLLPQCGYAQIGSFATIPQQRRRGLGTRVLAAIRSSLAHAGIGKCGLYADGSNPALPAFYRRRGFKPAGRVRFITIE